MTVTFNSLGNYGRFGNQLFQIASTIGIALRNNQDYAFPEWEYQKYFNNRLPSSVNVRFDGALHEATTYYHDVNLCENKNYDLVGYFQSYLYFENYRDRVFQYFIPNFETNTPEEDQVAVHVRRGDYLTLSNHPVLDMDYYNEAMSLFPNSRFVVFSDDISWCIDNFNHSNCYFVKESTLGNIGDFFYMNKFDKIIIANSSFSWWSAYLNLDDKNKIVVAPEVYVNSEVHTIDRYPGSWIIR